MKAKSIQSFKRGEDPYNKLNVGLSNIPLYFMTMDLAGYEHYVVSDTEEGAYKAMENAFYDFFKDDMDRLAPDLQDFDNYVEYVGSFAEKINVNKVFSK